MERRRIFFFKGKFYYFVKFFNIRDGDNFGSGWLIIISNLDFIYFFFNGFREEIENMEFF